MSDTTNARQLVVFNLGDEHYALPIAQVHEIIRYAEPRSVVSRTDWVKGVISLRGQIIPVYDLAARLGVPSGSREQCQDRDRRHRHRDRRRDRRRGRGGADGRGRADSGGPRHRPSVIEAIAKVGERLIVLLHPSAAFSAPELPAAA